MLEEECEERKWSRKLVGHNCSSIRTCVNIGNEVQLGTSSTCWSCAKLECIGSILVELQAVCKLSGAQDVTVPLAIANARSLICFRALEFHHGLLGKSCEAAALSL